MPSGNEPWEFTHTHPIGSSHRGIEAPLHGQARASARHDAARP